VRRAALCHVRRYLGERHARILLNDGRNDKIERHARAGHDDDTIARRDEWNRFALIARPISAA
jgi:hypothetical protein